MTPPTNIISVVIPLYNKADYIARAVFSVLAQGSAIGEIIIVDDGSTDEGSAVLDSIGDSRIRVIRQINSGAAAARNVGIAAAKFPYVAFLDADDVWLPTFVSELIALMLMFPQATTFATSFARVWPGGRRVPVQLPKELIGLERQILTDPFSAWSANSFFSISTSSCVRRSALNDHDIRFPIGEKLGEDQDVIFQLMIAGDIAFSTKTLAEYSQAIPGSAYTSLPSVVLPCYTRLLEQTRLATFPAKHRRGARRVVGTSYLNTAVMLISKGQRFAAARLTFSHLAISCSLHWLKTVLRLFLPPIAIKK